MDLGYSFHLEGSQRKLVGLGEKLLILLMRLFELDLGLVQKTDPEGLDLEFLPFHFLGELQVLLHLVTISEGYNGVLRHQLF